MGNSASQEGARKIQLKHIPGGSNARANFVMTTEESQKSLEEAFTTLEYVRNVSQ